MPARGTTGTSGYTAYMAIQACLDCIAPRILRVNDVGDQAYMDSCCQCHPVRTSASATCWTLILPFGQDTPRWKLRATGFDGVLVSRTGTNILCQAGRLLRPIKIYYGTDGYYPEGAQVTTVAVDSRYVCLLYRHRLMLHGTLQLSSQFSLFSTTSLWKESFHLLGLRYSWKYVDGRQVSCKLLSSLLIM